MGQWDLAATIRFAARLPVAFSFHERLLAVYADLSKRAYIWRWLELRKHYTEAFRSFQIHHPRPLPKLRALADELDVDVIVTEVSLNDWQLRELGRTTFRNEVLTVIDIREPGPGTGRQLTNGGQEPGRRRGVTGNPKYLSLQVGITYSPRPVPPFRDRRRRR